MKIEDQVVRLAMAAHSLGERVTEVCLVTDGLGAKRRGDDRQRSVLSHGATADDVADRCVETPVGKVLLRFVRDEAGPSVQDRIEFAQACLERGYLTPEDAELVVFPDTRPPRKRSLWQRILDAMGWVDNMPNLDDVMTQVLLYGRAGYWVQDAVEWSGGALGLSDRYWT